MQSRALIQSIDSFDMNQYVGVAIESVDMNKNVDRIERERQYKRERWYNADTNEIDAIECIDTFERQYERGQ